MHIEGDYDRLLRSVLPHEVTHTVFAHYFRCPVPRWADEGGSVLSEDDEERRRHDVEVRRFLNEGRAFPLRRLFTLRDYPRDMSQVGCLYAEGFSMANYLVGVSDRQTYLKFVAQGMTDPRVPPSESEQVVDSLKSRNRPVEYLTFPDEGHGFVKLPNRIAVYTRVAQFLETHLLDGER